MFTDEEIAELIIKARRQYARTLQVIRDSDMVEETRGYCNHIILDVDEERAFSTFHSMGTFEKLEFSILLNEIYGHK